MGLQNFIGRENVYELYFITCKEAQSKQIFPFYICIDKCGPRGVLTKYVALLWVVNRQLCFSEFEKVAE